MPKKKLIKFIITLSHNYLFIQIYYINFNQIGLFFYFNRLMNYFNNLKLLYLN